MVGALRKPQTRVWAFHCLAVWPMDDFSASLSLILPSSSSPHCGPCHIVAFSYHSLSRPWVFFFPPVLGLELQAFTLSHSTSPIYYLPGLTSNCKSPDLYLLSSQDDRREPPAPSSLNCDSDFPDVCPTQKGSSPTLVTFSSHDPVTRSIALTPSLSSLPMCRDTGQPYWPTSRQHNLPGLLQETSLSLFSPSKTPSQITAHAQSPPWPPLWDRSSGFLPTGPPLLLYLSSIQAPLPWQLTLWPPHFSGVFYLPCP
jgi:hypothetical protein